MAQEISEGVLPIGKRAMDAQWRREFKHNFDLLRQNSKLKQSDIVDMNNAREKDGWLKLERFDLSRYATGKQTVKIVHLRQIAELLGVQPADLVPSYVAPTVSGGNRMARRDLGNGKTLVDFCAVVDTETARKLMLLLNSESSLPSH